MRYLNIFSALVAALMSMAMGNVQAEEKPDAASPEVLEAGHNKNYLYLTGEQDSLSPAGSGGGGGIEWTHSNAPKKMSTTLGFSRLNLAGSSVSYLKLGAFWKHENGVAYHVEARGGSGNQSGSSFDYRMLKGGITFLLLDRLSLDLEDEYIHVAQTEANLLRSTVNYVPLPWLGTVVKYQETTGGSFRMDFLSGELDLYIKGIKIYGGYGSGRYVLNQNFIPNSTVLNTQEKFYGIKFPIGSSELDLIWDLISQPGTQRKSVTLGLKVPFLGEN